MNVRRLFVTVAATATMALVSAPAAWGCTEAIIGPDCSTDGSWIIARTEDITNAKHVVIHDATTYEEGTQYEGPYGLVMDYPSLDGARYVAEQDSPDYGDGENAYGEAGFNEYGVGLTATESASASDAIYEVDPLVDTGLCEVDMLSTTLPFVKTAKEGVELAGKIVDEQGAGEGNSIVFVDGDEAWYMEILSGHQWAAVRIPTDQIAVVTNEFMLQSFDPDSEDTLSSAGLISMPEEAGLLVKGEDGLIDIFDTYAAPHDVTYCTDRVELGSRLLSPSYSGSMNDEDIPLFFTPDDKISLQDVMEFQKYRFQGTDYADKVNVGNEDYYRPIGVERQADCHILQVRPDMPAQMAGLMWMCQSPSEFGVYTPMYESLITDAPVAYKNGTSQFTEDSAWQSFKALNTLCMIDRDVIGAGVRDFWYDYQAEMIEDQADIDAQMMALLEDGDIEGAESMATGTYGHIALTNLGIAQDMYHQVMSYYQTYIATPVMKENFVPTEATDGITPDYVAMDAADVDMDAISIMPDGSVTEAEMGETDDSSTADAEESVSEEAPEQDADAEEAPEQEVAPAGISGGSYALIGFMVLVVVLGFAYGKKE